MFKRRPHWRLICAASALLLASCANNSKLPPPVVARGVQLTPLSASVQSIASTNSDAWQAKVSSYFKKVEVFSGSETSTCSDCSTR